MPARRHSYLLLLLVVLIWGVAGPVIKYTLSWFDPLTFLTYRFFLTSLILVPAVLIFLPRTWSTLAKFDIRDWVVLIACGLLGSSIQLGLLFWGFDLTTSIEGSLINSTASIWVALASVYVLGDRITKREKAGLFIAFFGSIFIVIGPAISDGFNLSGNLLGNLLVLAATLGWVGYALLTKRQLRHRLPPLFLTASLFFWGFISMSIIFFFIPFSSGLWKIITAPAAAHAGVLYMALISGAIAYWLYGLAVKSIETSEADVFLYLVPLVSVPLGYFWLGEPITWSFIVGGVIVAAGVFIAETKKRAKAK